jgi:hypothetical protein
MATEKPLPIEKMVFRKTNSHPGRSVSVTPSNSTNSVPNHRISFLWAMAAHRETEDRQFGVVNVQPEFNQGSSGLEASRN